MKRILQLILALSMLASFASAAQSYPTKPVRIIVPYPPGGPVDTLARELAAATSTALGQPFLVEPRPGANGVLGTSFVAGAAPDGYTLLLGAVGAHINVPALSAKPPYDGIKEFAPIVMTIIAPNVLVTGPNLKVGNLQQFIDLAKAKAGAITIASAGSGGSTHIAGEIFQDKARVKLTHVPYKGGAPAATDLVGGHVDSAFLGVSLVMPHVKAGRMRGLAVASKARSQSMPDVPTFEELGIRDFVAGTWYGLLAPAGTSPAIVQSIYSAVARHIGQASVRARLEGAGLEIFLLDPSAFLAFMHEQKSDMAKVIKSAGIKLEQ